MNCCGMKKKKSGQNQDSESIEDDYPAELNPFTMESTIQERKEIDKITLGSKTKPVKLSKDKSTNISKDNYPEELSPFADKSISEDIETGRNALAMCSESTTEPGEQNYSNSDQTKTMSDGKPWESGRSDYPEHFNPFDDDENSDAGSTQLKIMDSQNVDTVKSLEVNLLNERPSKVSIDRNILGAEQKSKLHLSWKKLRAKRFWLTKKKKNGKNADTKRLKIKATIEKTEAVFVSSAGEETKTDLAEKEKKSRKWRSKWKSSKGRGYVLTDRKTQNTDVGSAQSKHNSDKHTPIKTATSSTTSTANIPDTTMRKKKTWRSRLHIRKKKLSRQKPKKQSVDKVTNSKRRENGWWLKLRSKPIETLANHKQMDSSQTDYPEHLNPFADYENSEAGSTQQKEQRDSETVDSGKEKPGARYRKKKNWHNRLHIRKKICSGKKQKKQSADQETNSKGTKKRLWSKLGRKQKKVSEGKNVVSDKKASEIVEDDKVAFKSKYLQDINPQTAAQLKSIKIKRELVSRSDIKIKQTRWWKFGKRHKARVMGENVPHKEEMIKDRVVEDGTGKGKDWTDSPKKKKSIWKKFSKAFKPRKIGRSTSNFESTPAICDSASDNAQKSSNKLKGKAETKSDGKGENSHTKEKAGLKDSGDRKLRSTITELRKGWKKFNQWLDE